MPIGVRPGVTLKHSRGSARLQKAVVRGDLPVFCIAEFVRVVTHLRVFTPPSDLRTALDFIDRLMESPSSRLLLPGQTYPSTFRSVCETAKVRGNLAFDAQIVASCIEHGVHDLITADRDFARFTAISPRFL